MEHVFDAAVLLENRSFTGLRFLAGGLNLNKCLVQVLLYARHANKARWTLAFYRLRWWRKRNL